MFTDLLLACCLANTTCAIINIMTTLIFIILIVSRLHAFFLVVPIRSSLHVLVVVAVICYFQHGLADTNAIGVVRALCEKNREKGSFSCCLFCRNEAVNHDANSTDLISCRLI